jgi:hypothetical protein
LPPNNLKVLIFLKFTVWKLTIAISDLALSCHKEVLLIGFTLNYQETNIHSNICKDIIINISSLLRKIKRKISPSYVLNLWISRSYALIPLFIRNFITILTNEQEGSTSVKKKICKATQGKMPINLITSMYLVISLMFIMKNILRSGLG